MPPSCVNTGNENVTNGEPKGGVREAVADPFPPDSRYGLGKRLRLGQLHSPGIEPLGR